MKSLKTGSRNPANGSKNKQTDRPSDIGDYITSFVEVTIASNLRRQPFDAGLGEGVFDAQYFQRIDATGRSSRLARWRRHCLLFISAVHSSQSMGNYPEFQVRIIRWLRYVGVDVLLLADCRRVPRDIAWCRTELTWVDTATYRQQ